MRCADLPPAQAPRLDLLDPWVWALWVPSRTSTTTWLGRDKPPQPSGIPEGFLEEGVMSELSVDMNRGCWEKDPPVLLSGHWVGSSGELHPPRFQLGHAGRAASGMLLSPPPQDKHRVGQACRAPG